MPDDVASMRLSSSDTSAWRGSEEVEEAGFLEGEVTPALDDRLHYQDSDGGDEDEVVGGGGGQLGRQLLPLLLAQHTCPP